MYFKYFKFCSEMPSQTVQSVKVDANCALIFDESWRVWKNCLLCLPGRSHSPGKSNSLSSCFCDSAFS